MPINGAMRTALSESDPKGKTPMSKVVKDLADTNTTAKKADPKNVKKARK